MSSNSRGYLYRPTYTYKGEKKDSSVWWCGYSVDGEKQRESTGTSDKNEAQRFLTRRLRELDENPGGPSPVDLRNVRLELLAEEIRRDYERNGRTSNVNYPLQHLLDWFGEDYLVYKLRGARIAAYVNARKDDGAANGTINRELSCLRRMLNLGRKVGLVRNPPDVSDHMLQENNVRKGFFTEEQFQAIRAALPPRLRPLCTFAYVTGWRKGELLSRDWGHVDERHGWLRLEPGESKSGEGRQFPLDDPRLREALEQQKEQKRQVEEEHGCTVDALFFYYEDQPNGTHAGDRIKSFRRAWATAVEAAGVPDRVWHDWRRTAVRNLTRAGVSEKVAMKLTGHKTRSVFDRYDIVSESDLRTAGARLAGHASGNGGKERRSQAKNGDGPGEGQDQAAQ